MAKRKAKKKTTPTWRNWLGRLITPWYLGIAAVLVGGAVLIPVAVRWLPDLSDLPEYTVSRDDVTITTPPKWVPPNLVDQVFRQASLRDGLPLLDPELTERVAAAFYTHPWVADVRSVEKQYPGRIHVELVYRQPVAMVRVPDGWYPVDAAGRLLPPGDFPPADAARFALIERVSGLPLGAVGDAWGDPVVEGASGIAAALMKTAPSGETWWKELELAAIEAPRRLTSDDEADSFVYQLRTIGGSRIIWGRPPSTDHPGELTASEKIERLAHYVRDSGGFANSPVVVELDIREWQGIRRTIIAGEIPEERF